MKKFALAASLTFGMFGATGTVHAQSYNMALCGASPGGMWSLVGTGVDAAVKASYPNSTITYQTSSGGPANVMQVKKGVCDLGIANDADLVFAAKGQEPFKSPVEGTQALAVLFDWLPVMWIARQDWAEEYGIEDIGDLAEKKPPVNMVFNRRGLLTSQITESTLEAMGVTVEDIESWGGSIQYQASGEQGNLMQNGRVDLLANTLFEGHRSLSEMSQSTDLTMLSVPEAVNETLIEQYSLKPWTVEAGTHPWQDNDATTVTTGIILFADESMDEETAYNLTKAMIDNPDRMAAVSNAMAPFEPKVMIDQSAAPFHPGAIRAYKEAGLM